MIIAFTGHRNKSIPIETLEGLFNLFPEATWIHGGAIGVDTEVNAFATAHKIPTHVIKPNYALYGRKAPLIRDRAIVDAADMLCACYDGRKTGGTFYTISYAEKKNKTVITATPV